jgi:glycosyltransferase involved in cell wall biosynthesis
VQPCYQGGRHPINSRLILAVPRICILSLSPILDDPRVRRQADAFHAAGWEVTVVGLPGGSSAPPPWRLLTVESSARGGDAAPSRRVRVMAKAAVRPFRRPVDAARKLSLRLRSDAAVCRVWLAEPRVRALHDRARGTVADIYIANDWPVLPIALELAAAHGAILGYDTHEYALEEYGHSRRWRLLTRPLVRAIEEHGLRHAVVRSTVSRGIAEDMARAYGLDAPLAVIRNVPDRQTVVVPAPGETITILYHGILAPERGLEEAVAAMALVPPEFRLVLRGPGQTGFIDRLERSAQAAGVADRVTIAPAVPMTELVQAAAAADIGLFAPPSRSKQNRYALPNKFFEYIQAGLALCIGDLPDMAPLLREKELGLGVTECTPAAIAATLNAFDRPAIERFKANSRKAAEELNWQVEQRKLIALYESALFARRRVP